MSGAQFVMTTGTQVMPQLCADSWDTLLQVHNHTSFLINTCDPSEIDTDAVAFSSAHFGAGIGRTFLDEVGCTSSERRLIDCSRAPSSSLRCSRGHSEDAGVRCQLGGLLQNCNITQNACKHVTYIGTSARNFLIP